MQMMHRAEGACLLAAAATATRAECKRISKALQNSATPQSGASQQAGAEPDSGVPHSGAWPGLAWPPLPVASPVSDACCDGGGVRDRPARTKRAIFRRW